MEIAVQPAEARVGSLLGVQSVIEVRDQIGHLIDAAIPVTVTLSDGDGRVLGNHTVPTKGGIARFTDLGLTGTYGSKTLPFAADGFSAVSANAIALQPPVRSGIDRPSKPPGAGETSKQIHADHRQAASAEQVGAAHRLKEAVEKARLGNPDGKGN